MYMIYKVEIMAQKQTELEGKTKQMTVLSGKFNLFPLVMRYRKKPLTAKKTSTLAINQI